MSKITELAEKLKLEDEKIYAVFSAFTDEQWNSEVYTEGTTWTVRHMLSHLVTAERGLIKLFEQIRLGGEGASTDFSIDRYNAAQQARSKDLTPSEILAQYQEARANSIAWVSGLKDEELDIKGRHPFLGVTTIREMIKMIYIHNQTHIRDMKKDSKRLNTKDTTGTKENPREIFLLRDPMNLRLLCDLPV